MIIKAPTALGMLGLGFALALAQPGAAADDPAAPANDESLAKELASAVEQFNARDPVSPDTLNARLSYADFQSKRGGGQCAAQLDAAQTQLDLAVASHALPLALPAGLARAAAVDYQIHLGRASCNEHAQVHEPELRAALESAKRAADLYRDGIDAVAMATMQFNVATTYYSLGETEAAISALQSVIDVDREYAFGDDAEDNYRLLLEWRKRPAAAEDVDALMQDFPERSTQLTYAWAQTDADLTLQTDISLLVDDESTKIRSSRGAKRSVHKGLGSWLVSYQRGENTINLSALPTKELSVQETANSLADVLTSLHDFVVARTGDFDDSTRTFKFAGEVRGDAKRLDRQIASMGLGSEPLLHRLSPAIQAALSPAAHDFHVAEDYNLETGTWIGASLDQGVWYPMTATLSLPLGPAIFVAHKMEFAFTRAVPCRPDSAALDCVEIVLRATPDPEALKTMLEGIARSARMPRTQHPQLWSVTEMRLITDPKTLLPYRREIHRHEYLWSGRSAPGESLLVSSSSTEVLSPQPTTATTP